MAYETIGLTITADGSIATNEFQRLDGVIAGVSQRIAASAANAQRELSAMSSTARNAGSNLEQAFSSLKIRNSADIVAQAQAIRSALNQIRAGGTADDITRATEVARRQMAALRQEFDGTKRKINEVSAAAREQGGLVGGLLGKIGAAAAAAATAFTVREMVAGLVEAQQAAQKLNNVLAYTAGKGGVSAEMEYLRNVTQKLGLDFNTASVAYGKFAAATKDTGITSAQMKSIFEGVAAASTQMGLSADETQGAFLALSQMASKGVVSAEELRGQLGERLPGAFNLAAKAMGVTTAELGKMLEKGQIMASDFLPRFGEALRNEFQAPLTSLTQEMNRFNSAWDIWKRDFSTGTDGGALSWLTRGLNESSAAMRELGKEAGIAHKLLVAIGGFQAGAVGAGKFDTATVQQQKLDEYRSVTRKMRAFEGRNLNYLETGELDNLRMQRNELKRELDALALEIGRKQFKLPDLAGEVAAQNAKQNERLKTYLDDVKNAPKAVKIAAEVEVENKAFQTAVAGLADTDKRYIDALKAHNARVNEIKQRGEEKSGAGNDAEQTFSARLSAARNAAKTEVDLIKDRVAQQLITERDGIEQTLAAQREGFERQRTLLEQHLASTKDKGAKERLAQQIAALDNEAKLAESAAATALAKREQKSFDLLEDYRRNNALVLERIQREGELALMNEKQRAIVQSLYKAEDDHAKLRERILRDLPAGIEQTKALAAADAELALQKERVALATGKSIDVQREFAFGWRKAFESYADSAQNAAKTAQDAFSGMTGAMEGAIKSFAKTGKVDFKSFGDAVINTLIDIQMQSLRTKVLAPMMKEGGWLYGLLGGGTTASSLGIGAEEVANSIGIASVFHDGGVAGYGGKTRSVPVSAFSGAQRFHSGGWPGLAADEVPAILQRGERVLSRKEAAGGGSSNVTINVDASGTKTEGDAGNGRELARRIETAVRGVLMVEKRPGGLLATA